MTTVGPRLDPSRLDLLRHDLPRVDLMGVGLDPLTLLEVCAAFRAFVARRARALVFNVNVDTWLKLRRDEELRRIYAAADLVLVDGTPLTWAARLLGTPLPGRVSGSDLFPAVCAAAARHGHRLFLLGGNPGVAERARQVLQRRHPGLVISTYAPPFGFERDEAENRRAIEAVRRARPDILFVGLSQPRQERWLASHRDALDVPVAMGVGSSFDYVAGRLRRAPLWMQRAGLEWSYRLMQEPGRLWRRYLLDDPRIVVYVAREGLRRRLARRRSRAERQ
jgi:N-acetylglucosaminyldiphosphoundecaprenol N-acetyl-beta-D-mannosaminyltransferase